MQLRKLFNYFNQSADASSNSSVVALDAQPSNSSAISSDSPASNSSALTADWMSSNSSAVTAELLSLNSSAVAPTVQALNSSALTSLQLSNSSTGAVCEVGEAMTQTSLFSVDSNRYRLKVTANGSCREIMDLLQQKYNATAAEGECEPGQTLLDRDDCGEEVVYPEAAVLSKYYWLTLAICGAETQPSHTNELTADVHGVCNAAKMDSDTKYGLIAGVGGFLALLVFGSMCCVMYNRSKPRVAAETAPVHYSALPGDPAQAQATGGMGGGGAEARRDSFGSSRAGVFGGSKSPTTGLAEGLDSDAEETAGLLSTNRSSR